MVRMIIRVSGFCLLYFSFYCFFRQQAGFNTEANRAMGLFYFQPFWLCCNKVKIDPCVLTGEVAAHIYVHAGMQLMLSPRASEWAGMVECLAQWQREHFSCWAGRFQPCTLLGGGVALVVKPQKQNWIIKVFLAPPWSQFSTTCLVKTGFEWAERSHLHMTNLSILRKVSALAENICVFSVLLLV